MSLWKNDDSAANSVLTAVASYNVTANSVTRGQFFGNVTPDVYVRDETVGLFGVDTTEMNVSNGALVSFTITFPGSGYSANATVTVSGTGTANARALANGRIGNVNVVLVGSNYVTKPTVTVANPTGQAFNASLVNAPNDFIPYSPNVFANSDVVTYLVAAGNTSLTNLANSGVYFITAANATGVKLSSTLNGPVIDLTAGVNETGHTLTGQAARAEAVISGVAGKGFHAGWVVRTVGSGGRAGRIQYETLVAMGSMTGDAENTIFKNS